MAGTEEASARFATIEDWPSADLVDAIIETQFAGLAAVTAASGPIARAVDEAAVRLAAGGRLIYAGAGTSGRIAAQDAAELPPTFGWPYERAIPLMAGGEAALLRAAEGAEDDGPAARAALLALGIGPHDVVIALAASGRTPYAIAALEQARESGALAVGVLNNPGGRLGEVADIAIVVDTGPEFLAGSTRLKAGTAQKVVLNCISTAVMIRLGFVHRGLMVEMRPTNVKLAKRAARIVADLTGADLDTATSTLETAGGSIKIATVMLLKSLGRADAEALVARGGGTLRAALR